MIGFRCNFATLDSQGLIKDRRAGRIHDTEALSAAIQSGVDLSKTGVSFVFRSGAGHRAALALKGKGSDIVSLRTTQNRRVLHPLNLLHYGTALAMKDRICAEPVYFTGNPDPQ